MSARTWLWRHPEWWALGLSACAWLLIAHDEFAGSANAASPGRGATGMTMSRPAIPMVALMIVAMMVPTTIGSIRVTAARSLTRRRQRAVAEYVLGYLTVWLLAAAAFLTVVALATDLRLLRVGGVSSAIALTVAAVWQFTPIKRRALNGHHRTRPLTPSGLRADRDCLAYGGANARHCVISCGPLMGSMTLTTHMLWPMILVTTVVAAERYEFRPPRRSIALAIALLAAVMAIG